MAAEPQTEQDIFKIVCRLQFGGRAVEGYRTPGRYRVHRQRPNRAERPEVRQPSGASPRADEENRTDYLKLFLDADGHG